MERQSAKFRKIIENLPKCIVRFCQGEYTSGPAKFMGYTGQVQFENLSHKKSMPGVCVSPVQMIDEKSTDPVQTFYAEGKKSIDHKSFFNQLGVWGCCSSSPPPPPPPVKQGCAVQVTMCSTNQAYRSSVQIRMCSTSNSFI